MKNWLQVTSSSFLLVFGCLFMAGCSHKEAAPHATRSAITEKPPDGSVIEVARPNLFPLVEVRERLMPDEVTVPGTVAPEINRTVHVTSLAGGRAIEAHVQLGDTVHKGQALVVIHSPDLATAINTYLKAEADEQLTRQALARAQTLYGHGAVALKDLQQAQDDEEKAKVDLQTSAQEIRILGGDLHDLAPILQVRSPISGVIIEQNVTQGEAVKSVDSSSSLFTVADLSDVWVLCNVYENDLAKVHLGDRAEVKFNAYPGVQLQGRVSNISRVLDPSTRTAAVRVVLHNPRGLLRPEMFATVKFISRARSERMVVPASALFRLHDQYWVFRPAGPKTFQRTEVQAGLMTADGYQEILSGLEPGQEVVENSLQFASVVEEQQ